MAELVGGVPREAARRGRRDRRGADGALPRRRGDRRPRTSRHALKNAVTRDELYPVACGVATKNLGTPRAARPARRGRAEPGARRARRSRPTRTIAAFVFKTVADPFAGRISIFRVYAGEVNADSTLVNHRDHSKERLGALMTLQGKEHEKADGFGAGDIGAVAKLKDVQTGDVLVDAEHDLEPPCARLPRAGDELRRHAEDEGRRGQGRAGAAAPAEEDPTLQPAPRPADRGAAPLRDEPGARRGRGRAR